MEERQQTRAANVNGINNKSAENDQPQLLPQQLQQHRHHQQQQMPATSQPSFNQQIKFDDISRNNDQRTWPTGNNSTIYIYNEFFINISLLFLLLLSR